MFEQYERIIVFDVETTGLDYEKDQIIEFGAQIYDGKWNLIQEISTLVACDDPLPAKITEITGITDDMLIDGIEEEALAEFLKKEIKEKTLLIAYNMQFDLSFLRSLFHRFLLGWTEVDVLDVMVVYKDRHKYPHNLKTALQTYQSTFENSHRALDDVKGTQDILMKMHTEQSVERYINYITYHKRYGLFGFKFPRIKYEPYTYK